MIVIIYNTGAGPQSGTRHLHEINYIITRNFQNNMLQGGSKPFICPEKDIDKAWFALEHVRNSFITK